MGRIKCHSLRVIEPGLLGGSVTEAGLTVADHRRNRDVARPPEGDGAREALVEEARQRVHVRARVDVLVADLLRRDVVDGTSERPGPAVPACSATRSSIRTFDGLRSR